MSVLCLALVLVFGLFAGIFVWKTRLESVKFKNAVDFMENAYWEWDIKRNKMSAAASYARMLGYDPREFSLSLEKWRTLLHPEDKEVMPQRLDLHLAGQKFYFDGVFRLRHKNGDYRFIHSKVRVVKANSKGQPRKIVGINTDITQEREAQAALLMSEKRFVTAFRYSPDLMAISEIDTGRFLEVNEVFCEVTGYAKEEVVGKTSLELGLWSSPEARGEVIGACLRDYPLRNKEIVMRTRSGKDLYLLFTAEKLEIDGLWRLLTVARNITEERLVREKLRVSEEKFSKAFQASPNAILISTVSRVLDVNDAFLALSGSKREEVVGKSVDSLGIWVLPREKAKFLETLREKKFLTNFPARFQIHDGKIIDCILAAAMVEIDNEPAMVSVVQDISERLQTQALLFSVQENYALLFKVMKNSLVFYEVIFDQEGEPEDYRITSVNPAFLQLLYVTEDKVLGRKISEILPESKDELLSVFHDVLKNGRSRAYEFYCEDLDYYLSIAAYGPKPGVFVSVIQNIDDRKRAEMEVVQSLLEKETLLKEVHHRVKNNLQIIYSLLYLQMHKQQDPHLKNILLDAQNRVLSMALIHKKLYLHNNFSSIDFKDYLKSIMDEIYRAHNVQEKKITSLVQGKTLWLELDQAIPAGLIVNELISNALKYAFPTGEGHLEIVLSEKDGYYTILIQDDGIGIPSHISLENPGQSLGLELVSSLAAQLQGTISLSRGEKTAFSLVFPKA